MSPRFDHRPPIIAFLFLVVVAIAVVGTSARAGDGLVVAGDSIAAHADASGLTSTALRSQAATDRVRVASRSHERSATVTRHTDRPTLEPKRATLSAVPATLSRLLTSLDHGRGAKRGWDRHSARKLNRLVVHVGRHLGRVR
ncbi:MAG TPA: hypothetical protein VLI04_10960 [Nocardioidaceae bacterium]|nr:hypothetical protein [Nocardioidaceae bacterium]